MERIEVLKASKWEAENMKCNVNHLFAILWAILLFSVSLSATPLVQSSIDGDTSATTMSQGQTPLIFADCGSGDTVSFEFYIDDDASGTVTTGDFGLFVIPLIDNDTLYLPDLDGTLGASSDAAQGSLYYYFTEGLKESIIQSEGGVVEEEPDITELGDRYAKVEFKLNGKPDAPFVDFRIQKPIQNDLGIFRDGSSKPEKRYRGKGPCGIGENKVGIEPEFYLYSCSVKLNGEERKLLFDIEIEDSLMSVSVTIPKIVFDEPDNALAFYVGELRGAYGGNYAPGTYGSSGNLSYSEYERINRSRGNASRRGTKDLGMWHTGCANLCDGDSRTFVWSYMWYRCGECPSGTEYSRFRITGVGACDVQNIPNYSWGTCYETGDCCATDVWGNCTDYWHERRAYYRYTRTFHGTGSYTAYAYQGSGSTTSHPISCSASIPNCTPGSWSCYGSCQRRRFGDGSCSGGVCDASWHYEYAPAGYHCSGGSWTTSGYCGSGSYSCNGVCQRKIPRYECNGSGSCNRFDYYSYEYAPAGQHCSGGSWTTSGYCGSGSYSCNGVCQRKIPRYECNGSGSCSQFDYYSYEYAPAGQHCSGGSWTTSGYCGTGSYECNGACARRKPGYECNGSGSCNQFDSWTSNEYAPAGQHCSGGSFSPGACGTVDWYCYDCGGGNTCQSTQKTCDGSGHCTQDYGGDWRPLGEWRGLKSTDWSDPINWGQCTVPTTTTDVTIPSTPSNQPTLDVDGNCRDITINGTLTGSSHTLNVYGNWTNNGTFTCGTSTVVFAGSGGQSISGSSSTIFYNLTITNAGATAITLGADIGVEGELDVTGSTCGINVSPDVYKIDMEP